MPISVDCPWSYSWIRTRLLTTLLSIVVWSGEGERQFSSPPGPEDFFEWKGLEDGDRIARTFLSIVELMAFLTAHLTLDQVSRAVRSVNPKSAEPNMNGRARACSHL